MRVIKLTALACLLASQSFAAEPEPGLAELKSRIVYLEAALNGAIQQRDAAQAQLANSALDVVAKAAQEKSKQSEKKESK